MPTAAEFIGMAGAGVSIVGVIITMLLVSARLGRMTGSFESAQQSQTELIRTQGDSLRELKNEMVELRRVVTELAVFNTRLEGVDRRAALLEKLVDDLRRGEGFIFPLAAKMLKNQV